MGIENGDGLISCVSCWGKLGYGEGPVCDSCKVSKEVEKETKELKAENLKLRKKLRKFEKDKNE